jgi:Dolichyl-phosphate-mannose-protein mannosyltransferase
MDATSRSLPVLDAHSAASGGRLLASALTRHLPLASVTVIGLITAFYRLGAKGLWGDEVWEVSWAHQQPLAQTFTRFTVPPDLPLHFMLTQLSTTWSTSPFFVRLPSALLGSGTVVVLFLLGRRLLGWQTGLIGAALLAIAPYHVWYSQDARPYAGLAFYSLLSLYCLCILLDGFSLAAALGLALSLTLDMYDHLFALFPAFTELCVVGVWAVIMARRTWPTEAESNRRGRRTQAQMKVARAVAAEQRIRRRSFLRSLITIAGCFLVAILACLPLYSGVTSYLSAPSGDSGGIRFQFLHDLVVDVFTLFAAGSGWAGYFTSALFALGVGVGVYRRQWVLTAIVAWIALPITLLWFSHPIHGFVPRYFLFMQPLYLLAIAYAIIHVSRVAKDALAVLPLSLGLDGFPFDSISSICLISVVASIMLPPTWYSYSVEKTTDWTSVCGYLHKNVQRGDVVTGNLWASAAITQYCWNPQFFPRGSKSVANVPEGNSGIDQLAHSRLNVWYVLIPDGSADAAYVQAHYTAIPRSRWAHSDLTPAGSYADRLAYPQSETPAVLYYHHD